MKIPRSVVITGANSGIGLATAVEFANRGSRVHALVRNPDTASKLLVETADAPGSVEVVRCDVAVSTSVRDAFAVVNERGCPDLLVNNAGVAPGGTVEETSLDVVLSTLDVNVVGVVRCCQQVLPHMRRRGGGTIVNISSLAGLVPAAGQAAYASSKWALEGLSETLALEVARFGIRVAIVEPGVVKTPILSKYTMPAATTGEYEDIYQRSMSFYLEGATEASGPDEVALTVLEAATTDSPRLRWTCGWGVDFNLRARESLGADGLLQQFATLDDAEFRRLLGEFGEPEADVDV